MKLSPLVAVVLFAVPMLLAGCGGAGMGKYNVTVSPGGGLKDAAGGMPSVEVDLVGASDAQADRLKAYSVSDYFSGRDTMRAEADKKTLSFTKASPGPQTLSAKDPIWQSWKDKGATQLVVIANLPGVSGKGEDPRRLIVPLASNRWDSDDIQVEVLKSGVVCRTMMKPVK